MSKEPYTFKAHGPWIPMKGVGKSKCRACGLINLNNGFTEWAVRMGCFNEDHPNHEKERAKSKRF